MLHTANCHTQHTSHYMNFFHLLSPETCFLCSGSNMMKRLNLKISSAEKETIELDTSNDSRYGNSSQ